MTARAVGRSTGTPGRPRRRASETSRVRDAALFVAFAAVLVVIWEWYAVWAHVPSVIIPRPTQILHALVQGLSAPPTSRVSYLPHLLATLKEVVAGYLVGSLMGLGLAMASVRFRVFEILVRPLVVAFQSVPKIALAPLMLVWFGFGFNSKFALVVIATFFPIFVNGLTGFRSVDVGLLRMMRSFQASTWQIFTKVQFRSALPFIFAGLEIGVVHAVTSAIAAEFLGGQEGLGVRIIQSEQTLDVASIFAVLVLLALLGGVLHGLVGEIRKRVVTWTGERLLYVDQ